VSNMATQTEIIKEACARFIFEILREIEREENKYIASLQLRKL